jgi:hypothetical protein
MKKCCIVASWLYLAGLAGALADAPSPGVHLFILSGQSNMARLDPADTFTPTLEKALGTGNVLVVKEARDGHPIRCWYKRWKPAQGAAPKDAGDVYDCLMHKIRAAIQGKTISTITFLWMQGERDAREGHGTIYAASLQGLFDQLETDLGRKDLFFVIGRLSDYDLRDAHCPHWTMVRQAQMRVAGAHPRAGWVNTDDCNGPKNDLHYTPEGYILFGQRLAEKALELRKNADKSGAPAK